MTEETVKKYVVGDLTMELVFRKNNITNLSDLQRVLDAVEDAFKELQDSKG